MPIVRKNHGILCVSVFNRDAGERVKKVERASYRFAIPQTIMELKGADNSVTLFQRQDNIIGPVRPAGEQGCRHGFQMRGLSRLFRAFQLN